MNILFVAAEASPLVKVGGLADVIGSLPKELIKLGHDVRIMLPKYKTIDTQRQTLSLLIRNIKIRLAKHYQSFNLLEYYGNNELKYYLIDNTQLFNVDNIYCDGELNRFLLFSKAAVEAILKLDWKPDIVHCHDWHTALIPNWLKSTGWKGSTIFTIHNLNYQGSFDNKFMFEFGLEPYWRNPPDKIPAIPLNLLSQGIIHSDAVTTVSENYAREITKPGCGSGLDDILRYKKKRLYGIVNGIDYEYYNPKTDRMIKNNFENKSPELRLANKAFLQKRKAITENLRVPLIGVVSRLDEQKGIDLIIEGIPSIAEKMKAQLVVLGRGNVTYQNKLKMLARKYKQKLAVSNNFNERLAHLIYAGCDLFLMPSRYEPCGLGQLIAMRYGAIPIVRHTGGLVDTVSDLSSDLTKGTGFVFRDYSVDSMLQAIRRAIEAYNKKKIWQGLIKRVMSQDFSWQSSARQYEKIYKYLVKINKNGKT